jgi:hypothetical protein
MMFSKATTVAALVFLSYVGGPDHRTTLTRSPISIENPLKGKLEQKITAEFDRPPLRDVVQFLSVRHGIAMQIDAEAFNSCAGITDVNNQITLLRRQTNVALKEILQAVLDQVEGTYRIRDNDLLIVPK